MGKGLLDHTGELPPGQAGVEAPSSGPPQGRGQEQLAGKRGVSEPEGDQEMAVHRAGGSGCRDALSPPTPFPGSCLIFSRMRNDQDRVLGGAQAGWGRKGQGELPRVVGRRGRRAQEDLAHSLGRGG